MIAAAIVWDNGSNFLGASALILEGITDAKTLEALVSREGLALASDLGVHDFQVGDRLCQCCEKYIQNDGLGTYGPIILEIKSRKEKLL